MKDEGEVIRKAIASMPKVNHFVKTFQRIEARASEGTPRELMALPLETLPPHTKQLLTLRL
jgi:hypothetical protein